MSIKVSKWLLLGSGLCMAASYAAADEVWPSVLRRDAQALHDVMLDSHPGSVDGANPGFVKRVDAGLARAKSRAKDIFDYAGYWWALREYIASFEDNHVFLRAAGDQSTRVRWPGFLIGYDGQLYRVATKGEDARTPPLGAELVECDGRPAEQEASAPERSEGRTTRRG